MRLLLLGKRTSEFKMTQRPLSIVLLCATACAVVGACVDGGGNRARFDAGSAQDAGPSTDTGPTVDASNIDAPTGADEDMDGVPVPADCDDSNAQVYPGAIEDCLTPLDEDCDGEGMDLDTDCSCNKDSDSGCDEDDDSDEDSDEESDEDEGSDEDEE